LNNARASICALENLTTKSQVAKKAKFKKVNKYKYYKQNCENQ
jgi:hypothetical protein